MIFFAAVVVGALLVLSVPAFARLDSPASGRFGHVDGLRGFLALAVFVHHVAVWRGYAETGRWEPPESAFFEHLGKAPVWLFFMITGFLFWRKVIAGPVRWRTMLLGRVFRIGPLYLVVILFMLLIVFWRTGFQLHQPAGTVLGQVASWLALGLSGNATTVINGYADAHTVVAGVTWTLQFEWVFYLSLPLLALVRKRLLMPSVMLALLLALPANEMSALPLASFASLFAGMVCAALPPLSVPDRLSSAVVVLCLLPGPFLAPTGSLQIVLLAVAFFLVCNGSSVFGLLGLRASRRLGAVSYGVYLSHGLVLTLLAPTTWPVAALAGLIVLVVAALAHVLVERPGIRWGKRLSTRAPVLPE
ncbi:acyltransferase [Allokutzneria sp. NRRL B-24872]|uniref:acyltransferase family protein n=1 Tax=Allokutzneria sp. NRRL B-24872 TaxID=1137961 RepID=UPI000A3C5C11|nr:acyltransferase [Allokutzneria sp. NRRL B-24872]